MQDAGKKNCKVLLAGKTGNFRLMLSLAHYSLRLGSVFVSEQSFAYFLNHYFLVMKSTEPLTADVLFTQGKRFANLFKNEHIFDEKIQRESFSHGLFFISNLSVVDFDREKD